ncbi:hypothetical protein LUR56_08265 [Streptomyces sp. MT29]|nr:hypothetical protein [Streptomyces sp. MT29]
MQQLPGAGRAGGILEGPGDAAAPELRQRGGSPYRFPQRAMPVGGHVGRRPLRYAEGSRRMSACGPPGVGAQMGGGERPVDVGADQHGPAPPEQGERQGRRGGEHPPERAQLLHDGEAQHGGQRRDHRVQDV